MYRLPVGSTAIPLMSLNPALRGGMLSPLKPAVTFPATVEITPFETLRMRRLNESAMYRLPAESTATLSGLDNLALIAGPLSPLKPAVPFPATVVMTPFETLRTRLLPESAMYRLPAESTPTLKLVEAKFNWALVAGPLSPLKPAVPFPATVVITPFETSRMRLLPESAMYTLPAESTPTLKLWKSLFNWALVAGPLSPLKPAVPLPATVVITPLETLRMTWLPSTMKGGGSLAWLPTSAMYRL